MTTHRAPMARALTTAERARLNASREAHPTGEPCSWCEPDDDACPDCRVWPGHDYACPRYSGPQPGEPEPQDDAATVRAAAAIIGRRFPRGIVNGDHGCHAPGILESAARALEDPTGYYVATGDQLEGDPRDLG